APPAEVVRGVAPRAGRPRASRLTPAPRPRLGLDYCAPATGALSPRHGNARHPSCDPATTGPQHVPVGPSHRGIPMKRWLLAAALMMGAACDTQRDAAAPQRTVDPALRAALATATPGNRLVVIVNYDETVTTSDAMSAAIMNVGSGVIQFRNLDLLAALATPAEITAIGALPGVQGV